MYLTADSPETINQLARGKVYILGGLVDRNAHKGMCFNKAKVSVAAYTLMHICPEEAIALLV